MSEPTIYKLSSAADLRNIKFPELPFYIISALVFLDVGILLGAMNSVRVGGDKTNIPWLDELIFQPEIHQTHWVSTLLGAVSILMLGQIYFFFAQIAEKKNPLHRGTLVVLFLWLFGVGGSYLVAWKNFDKEFVIVAIKLAIGLFLLIISVFFLDEGFRQNIKNHPPLYHLFSAGVWLSIAIFWRFDMELGSLDRIFLTVYIFGFFSLTLFGSLIFILPILTNQKPKSNFSVYFNLVLLNLAAVLYVLDSYLGEILNKDSLFLDLMGPFFWGLAGFLFTLYVFDLIYKSGVSGTLVAMLVALAMFGFFVFDTLMKNLFPNWVDRRHFHFMFIGTLLITIMAIGSRFMVMQYDPATQEIKEFQRNKATFRFSDKIRNVGMGITIFGVLGVLTGFTLQQFMWSAISGVILFIGLVLVEVMMIYKLRIMMKFTLSTSS